MTEQKDNSPQTATEAPKTAPQSSSGAQKAPAPDKVAEATPEFKIASLQVELEEMKSRYLTACADLDNLRKRHARERDEFFRYGLAGIISELLPVVDNFELSLSNATKLHPEAKATLDGFAMLIPQLMQILTSAGVTPIKPSLGETFDPHSHQSVGEAPSDEVPQHTILSLQRTGYRLHDRVLRPAFVLLSSGSTPKQ